MLRAALLHELRRFTPQTMACSIILGANFNLQICQNIQPCPANSDEGDSLGKLTNALGQLLRAASHAAQAPIY